MRTGNILHNHTLRAHREDAVTPRADYGKKAVRSGSTESGEVDLDDTATAWERGKRDAVFLPYKPHKPNRDFPKTRDMNENPNVDEPPETEESAGGTNIIEQNGEQGLKDGRVSKSGASVFGQKPPPPQDNSGELTRRLVRASQQLDVQMIVSEAFKSMGSLRLALATGSSEDKESARIILRKLEKLVNRGRRKIRDLNKEENLLRKQVKAEREQKMRRAQEIKKELRRRMLERKRRENGYLKDAKEEAVIKSQNSDDIKLDTAMEAKLEAQAQMMASAEVSSGADASSEAGGIESSASADASSPADVEGGEIAAEGGSVDVAV